MMGDTQLQTVMKHYFDSDYAHMETEVECWELPRETDAPGEPWERFASAIASDPNLELLMVDVRLVAHTGFEPVLPP